MVSVVQYPHCRLIHQQWGKVSTYEKDNGITLNPAINYTSILVGITNVEMLYSSWEANDFFYIFTSYIGNTIQHNMNDKKFNIFYFIICQ